MLGIRKECLLKILEAADVEIVTEIDIDSIFIDSGKDCRYNEDGVVVFSGEDKLCK